MHSYEVTERGAQIVKDAGLAHLVDKVLDADIPLLSKLVRPKRYTDFDVVNDRDVYDDSDPVEHAAIANAVKLARSEDDMRTLSRGFKIVPDEDSWRYVGDGNEPSLFSRQEATMFLPAIDQDRFVVSGIAGALLKGYRSHYPILARSRYQEFGFRNLMEAYAFVGGYIVGKVVDDERPKALDNEPSFKYSAGALTNVVTAGATFHGDFRMGLTSTIRAGVLSPGNTNLEFAPKKSLWVNSYHSTEPDITVALITDEYMRNGAKAAKGLLEELKDVLIEQADGTGVLDYKFGNFGDYGDGDAQDSLIPLIVEVEDRPSLVRERQSEILYSAPYAPKSSTLFEIRSIENGLRFQNRREGMDTSAVCIDIPRISYATLFQTLVRQTQQGLGRTSPAQLLEIVTGADDLFKDVA